MSSIAKWVVGINVGACGLFLIFAVLLFLLGFWSLSICQVALAVTSGFQARQVYLLEQTVIAIKEGK